MAARRSNKGRSSLSQGLDREVYQVVLKIFDEQSQDREGSVQPSTIYDHIRRSNSSLNRKPKRLLEDSIERVLERIRQDRDETDSEAAFEQDTLTMHHTHSSNALNRSIVGTWSTSSTIRRDGAATANQAQEQSETSLLNGAGNISKKRLANGEPTSKRRKGLISTPIDRSPPSHVNLTDFGGIETIIEQFTDLLVLPLTSPDLFSDSSIQPPRGILIHGPPGCGKTMIANAFAAELGVNFISISAPSIVSGMSGESEKALRDHFEEAKKCAPCLMFIDEIDVITPKRDGAQREMEKRIVAQLGTCMDDLELKKMDGKPVIVLAATNRPEALDPALRRGGRFDKEINMPVPNERAREQILRAMTKDVATSSDIDYTLLARKTPGFVGADLKDLVSTASSTAIRRVVDTYRSDAEATQMDLDIVEGHHPVPPETGDDDTSGAVGKEVAATRRLIQYCKKRQAEFETRPTINEHQEFAREDMTRTTMQLTMSDFLLSLPTIQPSALREGFATIPSTTFESIGALTTQITELQRSVIRPILEPSLYTSLGISPMSGALLWGPPGNGKTLLAKAVANSSHANFISVKGPELLNKYVGESERAVRQVFNRARSSVPVIIFFDELDALAPRRDVSQSEASSRVVNTLLSELDGVGHSREGVFVIAATNRPDVIDPAMLRPGRLDSLLFIGLPDAEGRVEILKALCRNLKKFVWTEHVANVARNCDGYSGADLEMLLKRAGQIAIDRCRPDIGFLHLKTSVEHAIPVTISVPDFERAKNEITRSVSVQDMERYDLLRRDWDRAF